MRTRAGISLIECVVAISLLTSGVAGATAILLAAQRLQRSASRYHTAIRLASLALDRFHGGACPTRDTAWTGSSPDGLGHRWAIIVGDSVAFLDGAVALDSRPDAPQIAIAARRRCIS